MEKQPILTHHQLTRGSKFIYEAESVWLLTIILPGLETDMSYYSESESRHLREMFEEIVLQWPDVTVKKMFGSPTYSTGGTIFAMLMDTGIVLSHLDEEQKAALLSDPGAEHFAAHGRVIKKWVLIRIRDVADIERYLPFIEASYTDAGRGKQGGV